MNPRYLAAFFLLGLAAVAVFRTRRPLITSNPVVDRDEDMVGAIAVPQASDHLDGRYSIH